MHDQLLPGVSPEDFVAFIKRGSKGDLISKAAEDARDTGNGHSEPGSRTNSAEKMAKASSPEQSPEASPVSAPADKAPGFGETDAVYGAVMQIRGKLCSAVDRVELQSWKGHTLSYGGHGGGPVGPWKLKHDEFITCVEQEFRDTDLGYLGNELAFFTSSGRVFTLTGSYARRVHRFAAKRGSEICGLNFDGSRLTGVRTRPISGGEGAVARIDGRLADCLDQVQLFLRGGAVETYGSAGGRHQGPVELQRHERVVAVAQEHCDQYLGMGIAFYTSLGNVIAVDGAKAKRRNRFSAAEGTQIFGLHFEGSRLVEVLVRPHSLSHPRTPVSKPA